VTCHVRDQHAELVAAEPGNHVLLVERRPQPLGDLLQQAVAGVVPERVVDLLEVIEVDQDHRHLRAVLAGGLDLREQPLMECHAVRHPSERVVQRLVFVLRLLDRELVGGLLQGVRSLEHLPCEEQRREEDDDRSRLEP